MKILVTISRWLVGLLFIFSGLIKANDPLGFSYKLEEYFAVFGMDWLTPAALGIAIFICIIEVVLGFTTILGIWMNLTAWLLLLMIIFFTFLTFYSAYFNKVTDCGCFGDAIKLTPWESFTKDIILLVFITIIFIYRKRVKSPFNAKWNMLIAGFITLLVVFFTFYSLWHLPVKDFRPYKVGNNIPELMKVPEGAPVDVYEMRLVYRNTVTNEVKEFDDKNYPWQDTTWVWVETKQELISKGYEPPIHDFSLIDADGNDVTMDILNDPDPIFVLISHDLAKTNKPAHEEFNVFANAAFNAGYNVIGLTATPYEQTDAFRHELQIPITYYFADAITLKTIIRSSPGLVLLKNGVILGKWHYNDFPELSEVESEILNKN